MLKRLIAEGILKNKDEIEKFLHAAHDIDYSDICVDNTLRDIIERIKPDVQRYIFTASTREHALRCLARVGIEDLFPETKIIGTRTCKLETKHAESSFRAAMEFAGASDPHSCLLMDDSVKNIQRAKKLGWRTVLVGKFHRDTGKPITCDAADVHINSLDELEEALPELF